MFRESSGHEVQLSAGKVQPAQGFSMGSLKSLRSDSLGPCSTPWLSISCPESVKWSYPFCFPVMENSDWEWCDEPCSALFCKQVYILCRINAWAFINQSTPQRSGELFVFKKRDKSWESAARAFDSWLQSRDNPLWQRRFFEHSDVGKGLSSFAFFKIEVLMTKLSEF